MNNLNELIKYHSEKHTKYKDSIDKLESLIKVQCTDGNWNYDPYLHGMANGMILAHAVVTDTDAVFLETPDKWLCNDTDGIDYSVILGSEESKNEV